MRRTTILCVVGICVMLTGSLRAVPNLVANGGFENPVIGSSDFVSSPGGNAWSFSNGGGTLNDSGIAAATSGTFPQPNSPLDGQVGYLVNVASIFQSIDITTTGHYTISFDATWDSNTTTADAVTAALTDASHNIKGEITTPVLGPSWVNYSFSADITQAGFYTLTLSTNLSHPLLGHDSLVDNVSMPAIPAPEPASLGLAAGAALGLLLRRRR